MLPSSSNSRHGIGMIATPIPMPKPILFERCCVTEVRPNRRGCRYRAAFTSCARAEPRMKKRKRKFTQIRRDACKRRELLHGWGLNGTPRPLNQTLGASLLIGVHLRFRCFFRSRNRGPTSVTATSPRNESQVLLCRSGHARANLYVGLPVTNGTNATDRTSRLRTTPSAPFSTSINSCASRGWPTGITMRPPGRN